MNPDTQAGRSCPLHYHYGPDVFNSAPDPQLSDLETLYVVGGLYGNELALHVVLRLFEQEQGRKRLVFNGDFHWFDIDPPTFERVQLRELIVIKSDGRRMPFDRDKLARSVRIALRKRPFDEERIERIVNGIQRRLEVEADSEVTSRRIGDVVLDTLRDVDQVAYVRFASVYRNFREAKDFQAFLGQIDGV
jgi:transcriptional repressor NrdR